VKLESICDGVSEIKEDIRRTEAFAKENRERVIRVEEKKIEL
jgi:hypothetical protein